ncbi:Cyclic nucleotide-gated potassium channel [Kordia antarctica]|uniref:Cyclic nucleotide-gated potassium channel n=1 Tax=Kordia antarctica TaxID=1218801 RepID=A0A7L4ZRN3_9FLAO|nr:ion transporter [Kordia antarctica]QHI39282.1 Cyclic nucleotide-gated potassium channel [Kordia antarctica]
MKKNNVVNKTTEAVHNLNVTTKERIRKIIEDNDTKSGRLFDITIQILILLSIVVYCFGTLPNLSPFWVQTLDIINNVCYVVFTIEYFARIYITKNKLKYIFSFYGIIDLLAILPFLFAKQFDLRAIRALRIFRIISALRISKYNNAIRRFAIALRIIRPELTLFFILTGIFIFLSAAGIYYFENEAQPEQFASIFHSLWWAIITLTTVGYGDIYPITLGGRVFTFVMLLIGLGIITIPTGLIASALSSARDIELEEKKNKEAQAK